ncbi:hypothetical protein [Candidatus Solincola tengchongensis]|uniref:hypothetical protein n=1 Tax=Candidatus Solincola tengchongensis TaxID=2900693 RepID=UPI00257D465C|nr:hypothetical protein [Candidatus Solincola tengchongensis]
MSVRKDGPSDEDGLPAKVTVHEAEEVLAALIGPFGSREGGPVSADHGPARFTR